MSNAPITEEQLHAYVDAALGAAERSEVERHLTLHPEDAVRIADYRRQRELIRAAFDPVLREAVPERIRTGGQGRRRTSPWRAAAIVAWVCFGALLGWALRGHLDQTDKAVSPEAELVERARAAHIIYSAEQRRAVEVAASQEQDMIRWLSKRMGAAVRVPNLTEFGFEALGGRLLPGAHGPASQIMYQNSAGKRLTIYLAQDRAKAAQPVRFNDKDNVHVVFWTDGTLAFAVSGEIEQEELKRIAQAIARDAKS